MTFALPHASWEHADPRLPLPKVGSTPLNDKNGLLLGFKSVSRVISGFYRVFSRTRSGFILNYFIISGQSPSFITG